MVTTTRGSTLTEHVHSQIRADVLSGRHAPGSPLRLAALAKKFDVSTAVVREALVRLAERNLLVLSPNQGFRIVETSRADLIDLTTMRILLEGLALRRSVESGTVEWEARVVSTHHILARTPRQDDGVPGTTDAWATAHEAFHEALGAGCASPRLQKLTQMLRDSSELYRQLTISAEDRVQRDPAREHRELMELATARKADQAVAALEKHIQLTTDLLLEFVFTEE